jgi:SAM-dependent methyltransferase
MANPRNSIAKAWYHLGTKRRLARNEWSGDYWYEKDGSRIIPCRRCPKFDSRREQCGIPFGSPLRKCVVAATEAHLRGTRGLSALELGSYKHSYGRRVVEHSGGTWTGIEPQAPADRPPRIGDSARGQAGEIPFPAQTFDVVFGVQSFEHWEEPQPGLEKPPSYRECLAEIWRVLKTGGTLYLDAPIHLHGHEMFVAGDVDRILELFDPYLWVNVVTERWRYDHAPLPRYPTPASDVQHVRSRSTSYDPALIRDVQDNGTVWLLTITASKRMPGAA